MARTPGGLIQATPASHPVAWSRPPGGLVLVWYFVGGFILFNSQSNTLKILHTLNYNIKKMLLNTKQIIE